jgi:hypothetical protein
MMKQTVTKKKPKDIPVGCRRFKFCTGGYKESIIGKEVESNQPVWAETRYDKNALFREDRKYYRLYTFVNY